MPRLSLEFRTLKYTYHLNNVNFIYSNYNYVQLCFTPFSVSCSVLYKDVMYVDHTSQIHPPLCCWFFTTGYRTLCSSCRQVRPTTVHCQIRPPSVCKRVLLPRVLVQGKVYQQSKRSFKWLICFIDWVFVAFQLLVITYSLFTDLLEGVL